MTPSAHPLRFGLKLSQQIHPIPVQREIWRIADEAGFDHLWPFDHLIALGGDPTEPIFDGWTVLGAIAEVTTRTRMGLNVTGNLYRHPGLLAKIAVTVDHLSGGRLEFGIGTAWNEPEFAMLGLPFPSAGDRVRMLDESLRAMKLLWTEPRASFSGRFYRLTDAISEPKPLQRPHPPIWIGAKGPRMMRLVARHADVWHLNTDFASGVALSRMLDERCVKIGRDPAALRRSLSLRLDGAEDTFAKARAAVDAGFTEILFMLGGTRADDPRSRAETVAALLPRLRALGASVPEALAQPIS